MRNLIVLFLLSAVLLVGSPVSAVKHVAIPEDCSTPRDDDGNGIANDGCPQTDAFSACTPGYCANASEGVFSGQWVAAVDATGDTTGHYVSLPLGNVYNTGQAKFCGTVTTGTYYLTLSARASSSVSNRVWVSQSPISRSPDNALLGATLFGGGSSDVFARTSVGQAGTAANFGTRVNATAQRPFVLSGAQCLYVMAEPSVQIACLTLSTDANAAPLCPGGIEQPTSDYDILDVGANTITPNGNNSEGAWGNSNTLLFTGNNTGITATPTCNFLWDNTSPPKLYGYCTTTLASLLSTTTARDDAAIGNDTLFALHYRVVDTNPVKDSGTYAVDLNCHTATPAIYDFNYTSGGAITLATNVTNVTTSATYSSNVCKIEWVQDLPAVSAGSLILFDVTYQEAATGLPIQTRHAHSTLASGFTPAGWAIARLSSATVPAPPPDTTAPSVTGCTTSNVTQTDMDVTCGITDAVSVSFNALVNYCAGSAGCTNSYGGTNTAAQTCGASCTVHVSGLTANTTYKLRLHAIDGSANDSGNTPTELSRATTAVTGTQRFILPTGTDSGACTTSGSPCKTWAFVLPQLLPGETLVVKNGTYTSATSGFPLINCAAGYRNGTSTQPITVQAENERQAFIQGNGGTVPFRLFNCSYWTIQGLHIEDTDFDANGSGNNALNSVGSDATVHLYVGDHITFRRNILAHNNRYINASMLLVNGVTNSLFEENEIYYGHRNVVEIKYAQRASTGDTFRRNYIHSRNAGNIVGGYPNGTNPVTVGSGDYLKGDGGLTCYPCHDNLFENNVIENVAAGIDLEPEADPADNNRFYGNILAGNSTYPINSGVFLNNRSTDPNGMQFKDTVIVNHTLGTSYPYYGFWLHGGHNTVITGLSVFGAAGTTSSGNIGFDSNTVAGAPWSAAFTNILTVTSPQSPWNFLTGTGMSFGLNYARSFGNGSAGSPASGATLTNLSTTNPSMGSCYVSIPAGSNLKNAGLNGQDIGANVIYRYQDGVLTTQHLWDETNSYKFPCGATVTGLNDVAGSSCFDVHLRLHLDTCPPPY